MRRITIIAMLIAMAQAITAFSGPALQEPRTTTTLRRIQVNAQTIKTLATGKNYVVDLTQRGVKYEFGSQAGQIDFSRVTVRTARGEVAIGSFLEKTFPKDELVGFNLASRSFTLGTGFIPTRPPSTTALSAIRNFKCGANTCTCKGRGDCIDLIFGAGLCQGKIFCFKTSDGTDVCICNRSPEPFG